MEQSPSLLLFQREAEVDEDMLKHEKRVVAKKNLDGPEGNSFNNLVLSFTDELVINNLISLGISLGASKRLVQNSKRRELKSRLSAAKRFLLTFLESLDKKREEGILSPQEQEHKYCLSAKLTKLLQKMKIHSLQIEYQLWWKKKQLLGLKINFHKSKFFCYGAAKGSLAMFMFSFFEYLKNKTITQATIANVLQHNQLNVAFRRSFLFIVRTTNIRDSR
ncbi:hypothetical protein ACJX0J_029810 [Zea mays]